MSDLHQIIPSSYWEEFQISPEDLDFLFAHLLELEEPQTVDQFLQPLISFRIKQEKQAFNKKINQESVVYKPKEAYKVGQVITFPAMQWQKGKVISTRPGNNPQIGNFSVLEVEFDDQPVRKFASQLEDHKLNQLTEPLESQNEDDLEAIRGEYGELIEQRLFDALEQNADLVRIAGCWFPKSLLIDINQGHLNLCEAILEEVNGGPLPTQKLIEQVEIPPNVNKRLVEFSMNYALQEDERFDEVGPSGETLWFLRRLEPEWVQSIPPTLNLGKFEFTPDDEFQPALHELEESVEDELNVLPNDGYTSDEIDIGLIFPHWRSGTLPLSQKVSGFFPTADEAPRIQFTFVDSDAGDRFSGWVVRPSKYVFGLKNWYEKYGLIPGSIVKLIKGDSPGEIKIHVEKRRQNREWVRTALIGADGGIVFAMLKQIVTATFDERMAIAIPDVDAVDGLWKPGKQRVSAEVSVGMMFQELAKLNPQGHVHAQELYACLNLIRRCSPAYVISMLLGNHQKYESLGNLYFRVSEPSSAGSND